MSTAPRLRVLLLTPIAPAPTGNGLAMRSWLYLRGATAVADVQLVVVPVWGGGGLPTIDLPGLRAVMLPPGAGGARAVARGWLADPEWRERYARI